MSRGHWIRIADLAADLHIIAAPLDYLGVNYYSRHVCHDRSGGKGSRLLNLRSKTRLTDRDWEIYPHGLYDLLVWIGRGYNFKDIYLTENGASYKDEIAREELSTMKRASSIYSNTWR